MTVYVFVGSLTRSAPQFATAKGEGISVCELDEKTGELHLRTRPLPVADSTWLVADAPRHALFAISDVDDGRQSALAALAFDPHAAELAEVSRVPLGGLEGCHASLARDGSAVLCASYGGHRDDGPDNGVAVVPVDDAVRLGAASQFLRHEGHGPNAERQESPHAHCVLPSPDGRFVFVADLGIDKLVAYEAGPDGLARRADLDVGFAPGLGPRHFVFSRDGAFVYVVSELIPSVQAFTFDASSGHLDKIGEVALSARGGEDVQPAGIVFGPDERVLYVSARLSDEIIVIERDSASGTISVQSRVPCGGRTPRDLTLAPSQRHLLIANQDSDRVSVLSIDTQTCALSAPVAELHVGTPMAVAAVTYPNI